MDRRGFLLRSLGALVGLALPRLGRTQPAAPPPDSGAAPADSAARAAAEPTVRVAAGGDTTLGYNLEAHFDQQVAAGVPKEQLWPLYFAGVRSILEQADIAVVNLECPFTERGTMLPKNFNFRARRELARMLQEGSVDVASLANNHTADWGRDGIKDTLKTLDRAGIERFGAGMNLRQARRPAVLERRGMKVGFLGWYFQADPDMLEPEAVYATRKRAGVAGCYRDLECVKAQVREDLERLVPDVDAVIPYFHWGKEGSYEVRDYQVELAHLCVDLGSRAVLGAHPHRVQAVEVYRGAPIFYSLGNFVYGGIKEPADTLTMIASLGLSRAGVTAEVVPVEFTRWPERAFQPSVLEGEAREQAMKRIAEISAGYATLPQIAGYRASPEPIGG